MWQIGLGIRDFINVKEPRIWDMTCVIFSLGIAVFGWQKPRRVDDPNIWAVLVFGQPVCGNKCSRVAMGHYLLSAFCGLYVKYRGQG
jgi:hypothetical protein